MGPLMEWKKTGVAKTNASAAMIFSLKSGQPSPLSAQRLTMLHLRQPVQNLRSRPTVSTISTCPPLETVPLTKALRRVDELLPSLALPLNARIFIKSL